MHVGTWLQHQGKLRKRVCPNSPMVIPLKRRDTVTKSAPDKLPGPQTDEGGCSLACDDVQYTTCPSLMPCSHHGWEGNTHGSNGRLLPITRGWVGDISPQEDDRLLEHRGSGRAREAASALSVCLGLNHRR